MPSRINRVPQGLLSFLDLKAQGRAPDTFPDVLTPVVDLTNFYLLEKTLNGGATASLAAGTTSQTFGASPMIVADEQTLRLVLSYNVRCSTAAGDTVTMQPFIQYFGNFSPYIVGDPVTMTAAGGETKACRIPEPFWMKYNDRLGWMRTQVSAGNLSFTGSIRYVDFAI